MKSSSGKRGLIKKYATDFIFSEKTRFVLDGSGFSNSSEEPGSKIIKFRFDNSDSDKATKPVFRCIYKMMKKFNLSLN
ncbi:hypothetical protein [Christiangramia sp. LLG6405-1]|uniref:hypothetical protein n=1 Tax=Christiangramia sp. LLG6405-1 TaxID=3160832 RepID=UPI003865BBE4